MSERLAVLNGYSNQGRWIAGGLMARPRATTCLSFNTSLRRHAAADGEVSNTSTRGRAASRAGAAPAAHPTNSTACRPCCRAGSTRCRARSCSALRRRRIVAVCGGAWACARRVGLRDTAGPRHLAHVRGLLRGRVPQLWPRDQWCASSCWRFPMRRTVNSAAPAIGRPFWCLGRV